MTGLELHSRLLGSGHAIPTILITATPTMRSALAPSATASFAT